MNPFLGFGVGLRSAHFNYILENKVSVDWFEIISENYMGLEGFGHWGRQREYLEKVRNRFPVVMHGVSLSIGSADPVCFRYLQKLKQLASEIQPEWISDHLCWTGVDNENLHDLLPLPFTEETVSHVVEKLTIVQNFLNRKIYLENTSTYLSFKHNEMTEWEFISEIVKRSGCGILLDINNIYVNSVNHKFDAKEYINNVPITSVGQFHLAGHSKLNTHLIDTHDHPVCEDVWNLYKYALLRFGSVSTLLEWDDNIPHFSHLEAEVDKARKVYLDSGKSNFTYSDPNFTRTSKMDEVGYY